MLKRLKPKSEFSRNIITLMSGTVIAQAIPLLISPILTRTYSPTDFGILALYLSILLIIGVFATGRYELALPTTTKREDANNILALILIISIAIAILMLFLLFIFDTFWSSFVSNELLNLLYFMPINIVFMSLFNGIQYWLNKEELFKNIASNKIVLNILIASSQILFGFLGLKLNGLVLGYIVGYVIVLMYITFLARHYIGDYIRSLSLLNMKINLVKYKDFPLVNTFHSLSDKMQSDGVIFIITYKFSFAILGLYSMALRAITMPAGLVGNAIGQVVFSKFSKIYNKTQNIEKEVLGITKKLFIFSTPLFIILFFILPSMFSFIFGEEWKEAGIYAQILLPFIYINFIVSPVANMPLITKNVKRFFVISLTGNIITISLFAISVFLYEDFIVSLGVFSFTRVVYLLLLLRWIVTISNSKKGNI